MAKTGSRIALALTLPIIIMLLAGCTRDQQLATISNLRVIRGANQCALPGQQFPKSLLIEVEGPHVPGLLGGKGDRALLADKKVLFVPVDGSDLQLSCHEAASNDAGEIMINVVAGKELGDQYLKIIPVDAPDRSVTVRFITGISILGADQEAAAGDLLDHPIRIQVVGKNGEPLKDVPVFFNLGNTPDSMDKGDARIAVEQVLTNREGIAGTNIKLGKQTGVYTVGAEIVDKSRGLFVRGIKVNAMSINVFDLVITVLGGLAMFIFGMKMMSDGLQSIAGDKMKKILHFFASNRYVAILAGTIVTSVIQSSSACSVMVIGFVNAGLLRLFQAIAIVLGADIGTTVTAQIISFKLGALALPTIIVGTLVMMLAKSRSARGWGSAILGFGLLFFGMGMMGNELKTIGNFPTFIHFFSSFDCYPTDGYMPVKNVIGAFGIGALLTVVIQSSSASMGIIMALAGSGLISFYTAMPLMLGANVGTTITAVIACIPTNRYAKQVALAHVLTKSFGTVYMLVLFYVVWPGTDKPIFMYVVNQMTTGNVFAAIPQNVMRHVANAHTLFNVVNVILFIPLIGVMERVCNLLIPVKDESTLKITLLEPHLLDTPSMALEQTIQSLRGMLRESWDMVRSAMVGPFFEGKTNSKLIEDLEKRERKVDETQGEITDYLVQLTQRELNSAQSEIVPLLMHCTNDTEKIADHTENIIALCQRLKKGKKTISEKGLNEIREVWLVLTNQAKNVMTSLDRSGLDGVNFALKDERKINKLVDKFEKSHIKRLSKGECDPVVGIIFIEMLGELEKIGDHFSNIAERTPEIQKHYINIY